MDAKVYRWKYDRIFGSPNQEPPREEGRFYYEAPIVGCLQIKSDKRTAWSGLSELMVWHEKETLIIEGRSNCIRFIWPDTKAQGSKPNEGFWA